jgi:hypothetical protein
MGETQLQLGLRKGLTGLVGLLGLLPLATPAAEWLGRFDTVASAGATASPTPATTPVPAPWTLVKLNDKLKPTAYQLVNWDGVAAIEARADHSMALLARPLNVSLASAPVLCWRWRVDAPLKQADMRSKQGDDYAARLYVTFRAAPGSLSLGTRTKLALARSLFGNQVPDAAINYVWDNRQPIGTRMPNAYTDRAHMWVLRTGASQAGQWVTERRNIGADARTVFGELPLTPLQLAVASDTDNTGESARAGFADLHMVGADESCDFPPPTLSHTHAPATDRQTAVHLAFLPQPALVGAGLGGRHPGAGERHRLLAAAHPHWPVGRLGRPVRGGHQCAHHVGRARHEQAHVRPAPHRVAAAASGPAGPSRRSAGTHAFAALRAAPHPGAADHQWHQSGVRRHRQPALAQG